MMLGTMVRTTRGGTVYSGVSRSGCCCTLTLLLSGVRLLLLVQAEDVMHKLVLLARLDHPTPEKTYTERNTYTKVSQSVYHFVPDRNISITTQCFAVNLCKELCRPIHFFINTVKYQHYHQHDRFVSVCTGITDLLTILQSWPSQQKDSGIAFYLYQPSINTATRGLSINSINKDRD